MKKELLNSQTPIEKISLHHLLIDTFEDSDDKIRRIFLARNSLIKTNQYHVREYHKLNTTVILNHG